MLKHKEVMFGTISCPRKFFLMFVVFVSSLFGISSGAVLALKAAAELGSARIEKAGVLRSTLTFGDEARQASALYTRRLSELLEADERGGSVVALFMTTTLSY